MVPYCLLIVDSKKTVENNLKIKTRKSSKPPWLKLDSQKGTVPRDWIWDCVSTENLMSYIMPTTISCVLPIKNGEWDENAMSNQFWKNVSDLYKYNCGKSTSTPKTLEKQANFNNKLFSQLGRTGEYVVYNTAGDNLYAARLRDNCHIVTTKLFYVPCKSRDEAFFLMAILNSCLMLPAFKTTRKSDRDFASHLWREVPVPRYNPSNVLHKKLSLLGKRAEDVSTKIYKGLDHKSKIQTHRLQIKRGLNQDGVSVEIDDVCAQLFPRHVHKS